MEPFRALVADKLPESQRSYGFVIQTLIIGIGTWVASNLPWMVSQMGVSDAAPQGVVPMSVKIAFAIGAGVFLISILYTVFKTSEYPPEDMKAFEEEKKKKNQFIPDIINNIGSMPTTMKKLGIIQFFSWFAFFTMWSLANPALTEHVFKAPAPVKTSFNMDIEEDALTYKTANTAFQKASNEVGSYMGIYGLSSMAFALILTFYTSRKRINRKWVHLISLVLGGIGFISMYSIPSPEWLVLSFVLIGFAWGSILSMPYAMLSSSVDPNKMGVIMGIFNMFIVIPQIIAAIGGVNFAYKLIGNQTINAMIVAGISLIIAGICNLLIVDTAKYHFLAWKNLANGLGISFSHEQNEQLKGVSRARSLEKILEWGNKTITQEVFDTLMYEKNQEYLEYISKMDIAEILPDVPRVLWYLWQEQQAIALGSASKNARIILKKVQLSDKFHAIVDGTNVSRAKPDPEVFLIGAKELGLPPEQCIVFEDSIAGIQAANNANMVSIGIGDATILYEADYIFKDFTEITNESESLFSIGNGAMGQRANFEETYTGPTFQGSYIAGIYYPDKTKVGWWKNGYPEYFAKVLNAPNWIGIGIQINKYERRLVQAFFYSHLTKWDRDIGSSYTVS